MRIRLILFVILVLEPIIAIPCLGQDLEQGCLKLVARYEDMKHPRTLRLAILTFLDENGERTALSIRIGEIMTSLMAGSQSRGMTVVERVQLKTLCAEMEEHKTQHSTTKWMTEKAAADAVLIGSYCFDKDKLLLISRMVLLDDATVLDGGMAPVVSTSVYRDLDRTSAQDTDLIDEENKLLDMLGVSRKKTLPEPREGIFQNFPHPIPMNSEGT